MAFDRLHELTNNYNKATLLDKLIYWWQISKFTLNDEKIWFTRSIEQIATDSRISKRSVERYLQQFEQAGLIEKINKLYKKKNLYIRITDKLLSLLETSHKTHLKNQTKPEGEGVVPQNKERIFLNQPGGTDHAKMAQSIYKEKYNNNPVNNNTVSQAVIVTDLKNKHQHNVQSLYPTYPIEKLIGERLSSRKKNYIKGTMRNLQKQDGLTFSSPEQLFAEIVFTVLNEQQLQGVYTFKHRIQIIANLLRKKRWLTPKGFYTYADFGIAFKKDVHKNDSLFAEKQLNHQSNKMLETIDRLKKSTLQLKNKFNEINYLINTESRQLKDAVHKFENRSDSLQLVNSITATLVKYHQQQATILEEASVLNELILSYTPLSEIDKTDTQRHHVTQLRHQEQQLRLLINIIFDAICAGSLDSSNKKETDRAYKQYETLNCIHECIKKEIIKLEDNFSYQIAA